MRADWPTLTVKELQDSGVLLVEDGNHGEYRPRPDEFVSDGVCFIRAADMDAGRILFAAASRINDVALRRIRKGIGKPGDILLSHKGTVGKLAVAPLDCEPFVCSPQTTFWRVLDCNRIDRRFLYFFMKSRAFIEQLDSIKGETDMADYASLSAQRRFQVPVLEIKLQQEISSILGALDDKIELNRRMNETLEAMAQAIFKDWFVAFGPVRAKAEGRMPYLAPEIWSLFPDRLDGEGKPEGWTQETLGSIAARTKGEIRTGPFGSQLHQSDYVKKGTPVVMPANLTTREIVDDDIARIGPETLERLVGHQLRIGDIVYGRRGDIGRKALVGPDEDGWFCGTGCLRVRVATTECPPLFLFYHLDQPAVRDWIVARAVGATMANLNTSILGEVEVLLPGNDLCTAFVDMCSPLDCRARIGQAESKSLAALRDLLLPKLMSGEIRVKDAEKAIEEAA